MEQGWRTLPTDIIVSYFSTIHDSEPSSGPSAAIEGAITRAVIAMAHSMDLQVIAEGVETEQQFEFLSRHGCNVIQGYLISAPLDAAAFEALLQASR
jgi:EAL domain-containing protein (putative c-di-GMP-specific phosphodiesterase class I)